MPKGYSQCAICGNPVHVRSKKCSECGKVLHPKGGRPKGTTGAAGYRVSAGRPDGTSQAAGYKVSAGRPHGTNLASTWQLQVFASLLRGAHT